MHVLIATDGSMDVEKAATFATALADDGRTTVGTVVRVPRQMLQPHSGERSAVRGGT